MINLELDSIKYLKENKDKIQNSSQNYQNSKNGNTSNPQNIKKGLELLKITVNIYLIFSLITLKQSIQTANFSKESKSKQHIKTAKTA